MIIILVIILFCSSDNLIIQNENANYAGIVLCFDDYHPETWERHFNLFDMYNARVTFFVDERSGDIINFCQIAQDRGHEIGYHTINHPYLTLLSREQFNIETISRINIFRNAGIELTSFAYPFGAYQTWMHNELLKYYKIVRGFGGLIQYSKEEIKNGFIESFSIDNVNHRSENNFQNSINNILISAKNNGKIIVLTTHSISNDPWGITTERLEYLLRKVKENELIFYRFKDLQ